MVDFVENLFGWKQKIVGKTFFCWHWDRDPLLIHKNALMEEFIIKKNSKSFKYTRVKNVLKMLF